MHRIINFFKGLGIFSLLYTIISGSGDKTFFGWIIMIICIILTRMYLNPEIKKTSLVGITIVLAMLCAPGYYVALGGGIICFILFTLYYYFACDSDMDVVKRKIDHIMYKGNEKNNKKVEARTEWSAINLKHPFTLYSYDDSLKKFRVTNGFFIFAGRAIDVQLAALELTKHESLKEQILFWSLEIPYTLSVKSHLGEKLLIQNIRKKKYDELVEILRL